jgi:hypothetical protein
VLGRRRLSAGAPEELLCHGHSYSMEASRTGGECLRELPANRSGNEQSAKLASRHCESRPSIPEGATISFSEQPLRITMTSNMEGSLTTSSSIIDNGSSGRT